MNLRERLYRHLPVLARRTARTEPERAYAGALRWSRVGVVAGIGFLVYNSAAGRWLLVGLTAVLLAKDARRALTLPGRKPAFLERTAEQRVLAARYVDEPGLLSRSVRRLAAALGCTEGQAYTAALGVVLALLLSITGLPGGLRDLPTRLAGAAPEISANGPPLAGGTTVTSPSTGPLTGPLAQLAPAAPSSWPGAGTLSEGASGGGAPVGGASGGGRSGTAKPAAPPCAQAAVNNGAAAVVTQLDALTGGAVPHDSTLKVLAILTGCDTSDPSLAVVGALIELGDHLPRTGLPKILPGLPALQILPAIAPLLPALQPIVGPVCGAGSTAALLVFVFAGHYPAPVDEALLATSNGLLGLCAQLSPTAPK